VYIIKSIETSSAREVMMKKTYGITLKPRTEKQRPVPMVLAGTDGSRVVRNAAKRVISTHEKVIKSLANR
jgi:hypothetical protein